MTGSTLLNVLLILLLVVVVILVVLYFVGRRLEKRQVEQQSILDAAAQTANILVIDKKKLKAKDANLPKTVYEQMPKYMQWLKLPIVKAKIGPKVMSLIADAKVFEQLPVKTEARVVISGLYITQVKSIRGGAVPTSPKKKGLFGRFRSGKKKEGKDSGSKKKEGRDSGSRKKS